jgi:hypothetical protein
MVNIVKSNVAETECVYMPVVPMEALAIAEFDYVVLLDNPHSNTLRSLARQDMVPQQGEFGWRQEVVQNNRAIGATVNYLVLIRCIPLVDDKLTPNGLLTFDSILRVLKSFTGFKIEACSFEEFSVAGINGTMYLAPGTGFLMIIGPRCPRPDRAPDGCNVEIEI